MESSDVVAGTTAAASAYNALRLDTLSAASGHRHTGQTDGGQWVTIACATVSVWPTASDFESGGGWGEVQFTFNEGSGVMRLYAKHGGSICYVNMTMV